MLICLTATKGNELTTRDIIGVMIYNSQLYLVYISLHHPPNSYCEDNGNFEVNFEIELRLLL